MHRTGEQFRLSHGEQTAVVVELGGALRRYAVGERQVVDGFGADDVITGGRGQLLLPWPNRIGDGRYRWQGQDEQLPVNETAYGNAIHGLLRWSSWRPALRADRSDSRVVLECALWPQPGYPFHLVAAVEYALGPGGLTVTVTARNEGGTAAPYGVGQHPYLAVGGGRVDDLLLTVPARSRLRTDDRALPVASEPVEGTAYDFRSPRPIGALRLDTAFADLEPDADGRTVVRLAGPDHGHGTELWLGEGTACVQLYTGDTLPEPWRRRSVAVEPMSCPPDAFRSGTDLVCLEPGARHTMRWGLSPAP